MVSDSEACLFGTSVFFILFHGLSIIQMLLKVNRQTLTYLLLVKLEIFIVYFYAY